MNEDFFKIMLFPCPPITTQCFGITAITLTIQLPPVVSFTFSVKTLQTIEVPSYHINPISFSGRSYFWSLTNQSVPFTVRSLCFSLPKILFIFFIVDTLEQLGVRRMVAHDTSDMVLPPLLLIAGKKSKAQLSAAQSLLSICVDIE